MGCPNHGQPFWFLKFCKGNFIDAATVAANDFKGIWTGRLEFFNLGASQRLKMLHVVFLAARTVIADAASYGNLRLELPEQTVDDVVDVSLFVKPFSKGRTCADGVFDPCDQFFVSLEVR